MRSHRCSQAHIEQHGHSPRHGPGWVWVDDNEKKSSKKKSGHKSGGMRATTIARSGIRNALPPTPEPVSMSPPPRARSSERQVRHRS
eukprot:6123777-Pyramimonas_sp.AAC.1